MNKEALNERYPNGIPDHIQSGISLFEAFSKKPNVKSVTLMSNFGKDLEQSLHNGADIYKGLIIEVSPKYQLAESDIIWFHPEITKARSIYAGKFKGNSPSIGAFNSSVGTYSTYSVDELGGQKMTDYSIVDTSSPDTHKIVNHWFASRFDMKSVYSDYKTNKSKNKTLQQVSQSFRDKIVGSTPLHTSEYISLFKGANSYHFYNHVIKSEGEALVLQSSLIGYSKVSRKGNVSSDALLGFMDINKLSNSHRDRIYNDCKWDSSSLINTYVMRMGEIVKGEAYRMVKGVFSPNKISELLDAETTLKLTPTHKNIPNGVECDEYAKRDIIPVALEEKTVQRVLQKHWKKLISSKYIKGDKFLLPRDIVESSLI